MKTRLDEVRKLQKIAGILKENLNERLAPINKPKLVAFIKQAGPKPTGAVPPGEYNVTLTYASHPSIPNSYMTGARDVFMCVVEACGGNAELEGAPSPIQNYTVMGCGFDAIQAVWNFLASEETYENAGNNSTIVQANGCAQTWFLDSDYDQGAGDDDSLPSYDPNYVSKLKR